MTDIQIPNQAVSDAADLGLPARLLLEDLDLLGTPAEAAQAGSPRAFLGGPPQSVALIEAGITAATKWWTAGLGAAVVVTWAAVRTWWKEQDALIQLGVVLGASTITAAALLAIGYLIASDVRGRAAAAVATIQARASIAQAMVRAAEGVHVPRPAAPTPALAPQLVPLPTRLQAKNFEEPAANEEGWTVLAMERPGDGEISYVLVKGSAQATVPASRLEFCSSG